MSETIERSRNYIIDQLRAELEKCQADCAVLWNSIRDQVSIDYIKCSMGDNPGQSILDRLNKLESERSEMCRWFERHHITGDLSLEEKDGMTANQMADYVYEELQRLLDETRAKLPTMAQVMVYGSLLRKFKKSQADLAEATAALRQCEQLFNYLNNKGGLGLDVHDLIRKVKDEVKSCIGGAE